MEKEKSLILTADTGIGCQAISLTRFSGSAERSHLLSEHESREETRKHGRKNHPGRRCFAPPLDGASLELQPDRKMAIRKPLAVHNASKPPQVALQRADHQSFVQFARAIR